MVRPLFHFHKLALKTKRSPFRNNIPRIRHVPAALDSNNHEVTITCGNEEIQLAKKGKEQMPCGQDMACRCRRVYRVLVLDRIS